MRAYPKVYRAIEDMAEAAWLETKTARAIVRRSGLRPGVVTEMVETTTPPDLSGQFAKVDLPGPGQHSQYGYVLHYVPSSEFYFPDDGFGFIRFADFEGVTQGQLLVTVTEAGPSGSSLYPKVRQDVDGSLEDIAFTGGAPTAPLDEVGLHVSDWTPIEWEADPDDERPAEIQWVITNASLSTSTAGIGLCQLRVRGAS